MASIFERIPRYSDHELEQLYRNAEKSLDKDPRARDVMDAVRAELGRRHLPGMIQRFKERYPKGFYDDKHAADERDFKLQACALFTELLSRDHFETLLAASDFDELAKRSARIVAATNFMQGSREKPHLINAMRKPLIQRDFFPLLFDLLYGDGSFDQRFQQWTDALEKHDLAKWTYATYFLFLSDYHEHIFVKPMMLQGSLEHCPFVIHYEPKPSARLYAQIREFAHRLKERLAELEPRDMIDVHSFMWHMAPTGKWEGAWN